MSELLEKCTVCGALIDEEDLFCANCGAETPHRAPAEETAPHARQSTHNFSCTGCGASMSYDASAGTLRCPFCGNEKLERQPNSKTLEPSWVIPFQVNRDAAVGIMRQWLGKGFWRPGDLSQTAAVTHMTPVYVPYWVFQADTFSYWTADTNQTPPGASGDWYPLSGEYTGHFSGLLIGASGVLTPSETVSLCPFDLAPRVPPDQVDLDNVTVEQFAVQRKYARVQARPGLDSLIAAAVTRECIPGTARNVKVNSRLQNLSSEPMLLPVWVMAYRYKDQAYRFLVNGQTGRATGQAPTSYQKVGLIVGVVILILVLLFLCCGGLGALNSRGRRGMMDEPVKLEPFAEHSTDSPTPSNQRAVPQMNTPRLVASRRTSGRLRRRSDDLAEHAPHATAPSRL